MGIIGIRHISGYYLGIVFFWVYLSLLIIPLPKNTYAQNKSNPDSLAKVKAEITVKKLTATQRIIAEIENLENFPITQQELEIILLDSPSEHRFFENSKNALQSVYRTRMNNHLLESIKTIHSQINDDREWFDMEWLKEQLKTKSTLADLEISKVLNTKFLDKYRAARKNAVEKQWMDREDFNISPTPNEIEEIWQSGPKKRTAIFNKIKNKITNRLELFQENENKLDDEINAIIDAGISQLEDQLNIVNNSDTEDSVTKESIEKLLDAKVDEYIGNLRNNNPINRKIYPKFPLIQSEIPIKAKNLMEQKFLEYLARPELCSFIIPSKIKSLIVSDIKNHKKSSQSFSIVLAKLGTSFRNAIVKSYSGKAESQYVSAFEIELQNLINSEVKFSSAIKKNLSHCVSNSLNLVRAEMAQTQFQNHFPSIKTKVWEPPEKTILQFTDDRDAESIAKNLARSKKQSLLEETENLLSDHVTELLNEGNDALTSQHAIVQSLRETIKTETDGWKDSTRVFNHYRQRVADRWKTDRIQMIWRGLRNQPYMSQKYKKIFASTDTLIMQIITEFFKDLKEQTEEEQYPPPAKQALGETKGGGKGGGEGGGLGSGKGPGSGGGGGGGDCGDCWEQVESLNSEINDLRDKNDLLKRQINTLMIKSDGDSETVPRIAPNKSQSIESENRDSGVLKMIFMMLIGMFLFWMTTFLVRKLGK